MDEGRCVEREVSEWQHDGGEDNSLPAGKYQNGVSGG